MSGDPVRVLGYVRVSWMREEKVSPELQRIAITDWARRNSRRIVGWVEDLDVSGRTFTRRVMEAIAAVEAGEVDEIVVWKFSRFGRQRLGWAVNLDRVETAGGQLQSATEEVDARSAAGRFQRGILAEVAAFESDRIGEVWNEVRQRRVGLGLTPNGRIPWGWTAGPGGVLQPHPERGPVVAELYRRYLAGHGFTALALWLNGGGHTPERGQAFYTSGLRRLLDNPIHAGYVTHRGQVYPGQHTGLIDEVTWARYLATRRDRHVGVIQRSGYLLTGLLRCGVCQSSMYGTTSSKTYPSGTVSVYSGYRCARAQVLPSHGPRLLSTRLVEGAVLDWLRPVAAETEAISRTLPEDADIVPDELDGRRVTAELASHRRQLVALTRHLAAGIVPTAAYITARDDIQARCAELETQLQILEDKRTLAPVRPVAQAQGLIAGWHTLPLDACRTLLRDLIRSVTVTPGRDWSVTVEPTWEKTP